MKPKERFYGYALMPANCDEEATKDDSPIDLSTKKHSPATHSISPYTSSDFDAHSIESPPNYGDWSSKYCLSSPTPNLHASNLQIQTPSNLLPYLLLNRSCFDIPSSPTESVIGLKASNNNVVYDQFGNSYKLGHDRLGHELVSLSPSPYIKLCKTNSYERVHNGSHVSSNHSLSDSSSPTTPSTHYSPHEYNETKRLLQRSAANCSPIRAKTDANNRSHYGSPNRPQTHSLIRSNSFPSLLKALSINKLYLTTPLSKSKSESNLAVLDKRKDSRRGEALRKSKCLSQSSNEKESARLGSTRKPCQSRPQQRQHVHNASQHVSQHVSQHAFPHTLLSQYYKNDDIIESDIIDSDHDKDDDIIESGASDDYGSDDALDLRVTNEMPKFPVDLSHSGSDSLFHHISAYLSQHSPRKDDLSPHRPEASPLDLYRQYYYYLMQQPAFASRAVAAVAVAETYAKLISSAHNSNRNIHHHGSVDNCDNNTSIYENENNSPDYVLHGSRTELRSADTTNSLPFDRKRISRPLTGKHVRHGTGASPSTLLSLRNMIQERQRLKEIGALEVNKYGKGKGGKRVKRK